MGAAILPQNENERLGGAAIYGLLNELVYVAVQRHW